MASKLFPRGGGSSGEYPVVLGSLLNLLSGWMIFTLVVISAPGGCTVTIEPPSTASCSMTFFPENKLTVLEIGQASLHLNVTCSDFIGSSSSSPSLLLAPAIYVDVEDPSLLKLDGPNLLNLTTVNGVVVDHHMFNLTFIGRQFGTSFVKFQLVWVTGGTESIDSVPPPHAMPLVERNNGDNVRGGSESIIAPASPSASPTVVSTHLSQLLARYEVGVILPPSSWTLVFQVVLGCMIVLYNFGFGCKVQASLIVKIIKKPVAPAIGFCCQFLIMAPVSFGIAKLLRLPAIFGLGLLAIGAAPGGGGSNVFAYLLDGDLELSITMSFISTLASLGMTPLWIWGLGRFFNQRDSNAPPIPVISVFSSLAVVTLPVIIGVLVNKCRPRAAERIAWCLKPATGIIGIVFISLGVYVYHYALMRVQWRTFLACLLVPLIGYLVGGCAGKIFRQGKKQCITISLETGFQNLALSLMILNMALEPPDSDLAGVVPICYTFMSATFPVVAFLIKMAVRLHRHRTKSHESSSSDNQNSPEVAVIGVTNDHSVPSLGIGNKVFNGGRGQSIDIPQSIEVTHL